MKCKCGNRSLDHGDCVYEAPHDGMTQGIWHEEAACGPLVRAPDSPHGYEVQPVAPKPLEPAVQQPKGINPFTWTGA